MASKKESQNRKPKISLVRPLENDVDALFKASLNEFISARKTLAARLKQGGQASEADRVKALVKPSITAWAVNQLYWKHQEEFDRLIETGQRFRQAQTSRSAGKMTDMRVSLDERREVLSDLSRLADALLRDAGHNPSPDTIRRITTTLEAMSAYASLPDGLQAGRLTQDVDPPGFDSLASFVPGAAMPERKKEPARIPLPKHNAPPSPPKKAAPVGNVRRIEDSRQAKVSAAKASLQDAKRELVKARILTQNAELAQRKALADAKEKEKHRLDAEKRFEKTRAAAEDAARRAQTAAGEVDEAAKILEDAELAVEEASKVLKSLV
ncbi:MAG TPA: hypothetical protein VN476_06435 [Pyrinomonadaceae bacterium]|nr:hypothetical protein [Pyrinomonadaceae bacterium]